MPKTFLMLGTINVLLCIALGAFGSHGLKQILSPETMATYQTGVQYHFYHALGLILLGLIRFHMPSSRLIPISGWLMLMGILLFSINLYVMSLTGMRQLGMVAPFGGLSFMSAWIILTYAIWKEK